MPEIKEESIFRQWSLWWFFLYLTSQHQTFSQVRHQPVNTIRGWVHFFFNSKTNTGFQLLVFFGGGVDFSWHPKICFPWYMHDYTMLFFFGGGGHSSVYKNWSDQNTCTPPQISTGFCIMDFHPPVMSKTNTHFLSISLANDAISYLSIHIKCMVADSLENKHDKCVWNQTHEHYDERLNSTTVLMLPIYGSGRSNMRLCYIPVLIGWTVPQSNLCSISDQIFD